MRPLPLLMTALTAALLGLLAVWWAGGASDGVVETDPAVKPLEEPAPTRRARRAPISTSVPETVDEKAAPAAAPPLAAPDWVQTRALDDARYDDAIPAPDGRVVFDLVDARGRPLDIDQYSGPGTAKLWRRVGDRWTKERVEAISARSQVVCGHPDGHGLAAGDYELDIAMKGYGALRHAFTLGRSARRRETLRFPAWRRVIRLRFQDEQGHPVPWLSSPPRYTAAPKALPKRSRPGRPSRILVDPVHDMIGLGGGAGGSFVGRSSSRRAAWLTDDGTWHMRVFAGTPARIDISLVERWFGRSKVKIESNFEDDEGDRHVIELKTAPDLADQLRSRTVRNREDPGRFHASSLRGRTPEPPAPRVVHPTQTRFLFDVRAPVDVKLHARIRWRASSRRPGVTHGRRLGEHLWGLTFTPRKEAMRVHAYCSDGLLLTTEESIEEVPERAKGRVFDRRIRVNATPTIIDVTPRSAGMRALADRVELKVLGIGEKREREVTADTEGRFTTRTAFTAETAQAMRSAEISVETVIVSSGGARHRRLFRLSEAQRSALLAGRLELVPDDSGLVLRAVDAGGAGIAWAEATIVPAELDRAARTVRRLRLEHGESAIDHADRGSDAEGMLKRRHPWYLAGHRLRADDLGFMNSVMVALRDGKRYVVYFWSRSRDPDRPDLRVEFTATDGINDLGAVTLPSPL